MYSGGFYPYRTPEEHWAYWSRYIMVNRYQDPPKPVYDDLLALVKDKEHFVITTNVDHCFQKAGFGKERLFYTQGDYGLFQCSKPCCQETYDNRATVEAMIAEQKDMRVPTALIPVCPHCGRPMTMNLRADDTFVEDAGWHRAAKRYETFLTEHSGEKIVFLELGGGLQHARHHQISLLAHDRIEPRCPLCLHQPRSSDLPRGDRGPFPLHRRRYRNRPVPLSRVKPGSGSRRDFRKKLPRRSKNALQAQGVLFGMRFSHSKPNSRFMVRQMPSMVHWVMGPGVAQ